MSFSNPKRALVAALALTCLGMASCGVDPIGRPAPSPTAARSPGTNETPQAEEANQETNIRQWASEAEASSEYAEPEWSADQALGPPDAPGCGDYQFAWASAASDSVDTLTLTYSIPVYISGIHVVESFNPDQVVNVSAMTPRGEFQTLYESDPQQVDRPCPYRLIIPVDGLDFKTSVIRITVDQSVLGLGWNEIDAVQLIGEMER